jgi:hypothetical protein
VHPGNLGVEGAPGAGGRRGDLCTAYPGRVPRTRRPAPPPLEANDQLVTGVITAGWAVALVVLLVLRSQLPANERWWIWTCAAGLAMGVFATWFVPRLKRGRARAATRRADADGAQA